MKAEVTIKLQIAHPKHGTHHHAITLLLPELPEDYDSIGHSIGKAIDAKLSDARDLWVRVEESESALRRIGGLNKQVEALEAELAAEKAKTDAPKKRGPGRPKKTKAE